ncbi:hypothetical protein [Streptomyces bobili]
MTGFVAHQALFGPAPVDILRDGLRALMSVPAEQPRPSGSPLG